MELKIDQEFENHLVPLSESEFSHLTEQICSEGCRDPIVIWEGENIIVDGHNRYRICTDNELEFEFVEQEFGSREEVLEWIDRNQIARRNLSPGDFKIVSGRIYNRRKQAHGKVSGQIDHSTNSSGKTAETVAKELGASEKSIRRNGERAKVHDSLLEAGEEEAAEVVKTIPQETISKLKDKPVSKIVSEVKKELPKKDWKHHQAKAIKTCEALTRAIDDIQREKKSQLHPKLLKASQAIWTELKKW